MDTLILIVALWFIILGVYGAFFLPAGRGRMRNTGDRSANTIFHEAFASTQRVEERAPAPEPQPRRPNRGLGDRGVIREILPPAAGLFSEVDMLRAQVEELRSEIAALSGSGGSRPDRPRLRRYGIGVYTHLPRLLRRQVREVRSVRRHLLRA